MPAQIQRGVEATTAARSSGSEQGPHRSNAGVRRDRPHTVDSTGQFGNSQGETIGGNLPAARTANLPCVGHTRRPMPPTELPPANPPLSEPCHLQKSHSPACWNEPAPAWATHGGRPHDHGAVMHGAAMLRRGTTNDAARRRWHNESMSSHGPRGRHHTRQHRGSRHDQLADDLQEFS